MQSGQIITSVLQKLKLPIADHPTRMFALDVFNEIVQERWSEKKWGFRKSTGFFNTSNGVEEYVMNQMFDEFVPNTVRGSDPIRRLRFYPSHEFYKRHPHELTNDDPYLYRDGEYTGVNNQVSASSAITVVSSLANLSSGTANVAYGSTRVTFSTLSVTLDMLGRWILFGSDYKRYQIVALEPNNSGSSTVVILNQPYEGTSNSTQTFILGDVAQKVYITGYDSGGNYVENEELQLNGSTSATSTKSFSSLIRISKDRTHGSVTATSNGGGVTNIILSPGETEADFRTFLLYPIPIKQERINFECYMKHPVIGRFKDAPLFPSQFHNLLSLDLYIRLREEFLNQDVSSSVFDRRERILQTLITKDNDTDEWDIQQESVEYSENNRATNLPTNFGIGAYEDYI